MSVDSISSIVNFKLDQQQQVLQAKVLKEQADTMKAVMDAFNPNGTIDIRA